MEKEDYNLYKITVTPTHMKRFVQILEGICKRTTAIQHDMAGQDYSILLVRMLPEEASLLKLSVNCTIELMYNIGTEFRL